MGHATKDTFVPVNIAVLTVSDSRTMDDDKSGAVLVDRLEAAGHVLADRAIVKDETAAIAAKFREWADNPDIEIVLATGGTGLTGRDVTPEALAEVAEKDIPGFGELFRMLSYEKIKTSTIQSRACAGVVNGTYIFAVPGSPGACKDAWDDILVYQLDIRFRPCNFVEMLPRLKER
ncbi:MAG: molybdenum cofactor biosynthesis protein B [Rhodospirillales bacterium]|nr:molybdenum cofactor biosynthesis protein B [Alphaproteobacteria bacterium]MBL6948090.1 molybdenum cofactor biosynthesis protein B [Rhodospirillales bacterium]